MGRSFPLICANRETSDHRRGPSNPSTKPRAAASLAELISDVGTFARTFTLYGSQSTYNNRAQPRTGRRFVKRIAVSLGLMALLICVATPASALSPEDIVGTWKLLSTVRQVEGSDKVINNLGAHPNGVLIITSDHRFMIIET